MGRISHAILRTATAVVAVAVGTLVGISPASAAPTYTAIVNRVSGMCLDVPLDKLGENKQPVQTYYCNGGTNQHWEFIPGTTAGYGQLRNAASGKCLDVRDSLYLVQQYTCMDVPNQQWYFNSVGQLKVYSNGGCARAMTAVNKAEVQIGPCNWGYMFWDPYV